MVQHKPTEADVKTVIANTRLADSQSASDPTTTTSTAKPQSTSDRSQLPAGSVDSDPKTTTPGQQTTSSQQTHNPLSSQHIAVATAGEETDPPHHTPTQRHSDHHTDIRDPTRPTDRIMRSTRSNAQIMRSTRGYPSPVLPIGQTRLPPCAVLPCATAKLNRFSYAGS